MIDKTFEFPLILSKKHLFEMLETLSETDAVDVITEYLCENSRARSLFRKETESWED